jgi:hypothetical protein
MPGTIDLNFVTEDVFAGEFLQWGNSVANVTDLVDQAIAQSVSQGSQIGRLVIASHGATGSTGFVTFDAENAGAEVIDGSFSDPVCHPEINTQLERLGAHMGDESIIELRICEAGTGKNGDAAMQAIADLTGVPVTAPIGSISSLAALGGLLTGWKTVYPTSWGKGIEVSMWRGNPSAAPAELSSATTEPAGQYAPMADQTPPTGLMPPTGGEFVQTVIDNDEVALYEGEPISFDITDPNGLGTFARILAGITVVAVVTFGGIQLINGDDEPATTTVDSSVSGETSADDGQSDDSSDGDEIPLEAEDADPLPDDVETVLEAIDGLGDWEVPWEDATPIDPLRERDGVSAGQSMIDADIESMTIAIGPDGGEISLHTVGPAQAVQTEESSDLLIGVVVVQPDGQQWEIISRDDGETKVPSGVSPGNQVSSISGEWVDASTVMFLYTGIFIPPGSEITATAYLDIFGGLMVDILTLIVSG